MLSKIITLLMLLCFSSIAASAQDCNPPAITANSKIYNIFSPEQEMILGELDYQRMSGDSRFIQDEKLLAYLRAIGAKLVRHLPPTGLKFQFFIIDMPTANAFNTPGGYVFVSRKLISFTKTEDELAGVPKTFVNQFPELAFSSFALRSQSGRRILSRPGRFRDYGDPARAVESRLSNSDS